jgi:T5SS/PEP-CTERM-associated repeat protein
LNVLTGADLTALQLTIGSSAQGDATFNGAGSTGVVTNAVRVGLNTGGNGTLDIEAGATLSSASGQIGTNTGATGAVTVMGTDSQWSMTSSLAIGQATNSGTGSIDVLDGDASRHRASPVTTLQRSTSTAPDRNSPSPMASPSARPEPATRST